MMFFHSLENTALLKVKSFSKICYTENSKAVYLVVLLLLHFEIPREYHVDFIDGGQLTITKMKWNCGGILSIKI
jgi:hypothetical protein